VRTLEKKKKQVMHGGREGNTKKWEMGEGGRVCGLILE